MREPDRTAAGMHALVESLKFTARETGFVRGITDWLKVNTGFNIFKMDVSGFKGEMIDTQGAVTISPWDWLGISAGYRYFRIIVLDPSSEDRTDWLQKGPYLAIVGRF